MRATLITTEGAQSVRVRDLTSSGAGIVCDWPPEAGADVILRRSELFIAARVAWTNGSSAGLEFYREVAVEDIAGIFHTVIDCSEDWPKQRLRLVGGTK